MLQILSAFFFNSDAFYFILALEVGLIKSIALEFEIFDSSVDVEFHKDSRHTIKFFPVLRYMKKRGTFDFINPRFTNLYPKNSSNSTDFL